LLFCEILRDSSNREKRESLRAGENEREERESRPWRESPKKRVVLRQEEEEEEEKEEEIPPLFGGVYSGESLKSVLVSLTHFLTFH
jgi:hypothetical protein